MLAWTEAKVSCIDCGRTASKAEMVPTAQRHWLCADERACVARQERQHPMVHGWTGVHAC